MSASSRKANAGARIPAAIWLLGLVSLFTDIGSEMVHSLLPVLLAGSMGVSALTIGLIEGAAESLVLVTKVFSGYVSDALGRRRPLVLLGYGLAAAVKPLFPLADTVATVTTARLLDRFGKGIRGAPRDALIADLAPPPVRGASFGLRQALDTVGAVLGPLLAVALMALLADDIRRVLWFAALPGVIAVALLLKVPEPARSAQVPSRLPLNRAGLARLSVPFWRLATLGLLLALARFSEAFLVLRAAQSGLGLTYVPLVLVVMSLVYALSAYPAGWLSDRWPRHWLLALGLSVLVLADAALALAEGAGLLFSGIALWGLHMGLTQGVLASMVTDVAPADYRGTAFGAFNLVSGVGLLLASGLAGALWDWYGPVATFGAGALLALLSLAAIPLLVRPPSRKECRPTRV
ncbi:MFS transporter [Thermomonas alba]|uniref:MFS transporter n=1 Tax=Thermomonas alba TaxID=2888525 RepID=UPI001F039941|nr:MFS transporter [Thermomonas alba]